MKRKNYNLTIVLILVLILLIFIVSKKENFVNTKLDNPGFGSRSGTKEVGINFKNKYGTFFTQCTQKHRDMIKKILKKHKNTIFVEIGVFGGATLFDIYDLCKKNYIEIYGIDPHDKLNIWNGINIENVPTNIVSRTHKRNKKFRENIQNSIKKNNLDINYINDFSWDVYKSFKDSSISVLHIDGDHSYESVLKDLNLFYPKMKKNGVIIMDDYGWTPVKKAIRHFKKNNPNIKIEELRVGNQMGCLIHIN